MVIYDAKAIGLNVAHTSGDEAYCFCPFHEANTPKGCFNVVTGLFFCFSCNACSNAYMIARKYGLSVRKLEVKNLGKKSPKENLWLSFLQLPLATDNEYLKTRKVTNDEVERYKILAHSKGVIFPFFQNDVPIGALMRKYSGKIRYMFFGELPPIFPEFDAAIDEDFFLVEGVFGALAGRRAGMKVSCTFSASITKRIFRSKFVSASDLYVLFDDDKAGYLGAQNILRKIPDAKVIIPGGEADEMTREEWQNILKNKKTTSNLSILKELERNSR